MEDHTYTSSVLPKLVVLLIAVVSAAIIVALYHCIRIGWCNRLHTPEQPPRRAFPFRQEENPSSLETSTIDLIPARKYRKGAGEGDNITCAVCLCEFEEGEEVRTLPECVHSFHAACIDMWLYSHSNCPMCRTDATPSQRVLMQFLESDEGRSDSETRWESNVSTNLRV